MPDRKTERGEKFHELVRTVAAPFVGGAVPTANVYGSMYERLADGLKNIYPELEPLLHRPLVLVLPRGRGALEREARRAANAAAGWEHTWLSAAAVPDYICEHGLTVTDEREGAAVVELATGEVLPKIWDARRWTTATAAPTTTDLDCDARDASARAHPSSAGGASARAGRGERGPCAPGRMRSSRPRSSAPAHARRTWRAARVPGRRSRSAPSPRARGPLSGPLPPAIRPLEDQDQRLCPMAIGADFSLAIDSCLR